MLQTGNAWSVMSVPPSSHHNRGSTLMQAALLFLLLTIPATLQQQQQQQAACDLSKPQLVQSASFIPPPGTFAMNLTLTVPVSVDTSSATILNSFQQDMALALALFFIVPVDQVACTVHPSSAASIMPAAGRRSLQNFVHDGWRQRVMQSATSLSVVAQVFAAWASSNSTPQQQQITLLQSKPDQLFPPSMVQRYGIATQSVTASVTGPIQLIEMSPPAGPSQSQTPATGTPGSSNGANTPMTQVQLNISTADSNATMTAGSPPPPSTSNILTGPSPASDGTPASPPHTDLPPGGIQAPGPSPNTTAPPPTTTPGATLSTGAIVGVACGGFLLAIIAAAGVVYKVRRARTGAQAAGKLQHPQPLQCNVEPAVERTPALDLIVVEASTSEVPKSATPWEALIASLKEGELFLKATAECFPWTTSASLTGPCQAVEAGVNDVQLDRLMHDQEVGAGTACTAVQLTKSELTLQVQLLADGLLGRGGSALVFKCVWPSRFGSNALLAAKVVKDGFEASVTELQSFAYEARLLSSIQHPHVVKLYGYCLEPPTVCLILELLPVSLKGMLYNSPNHMLGNMAGSQQQDEAAGAGSWPGASTATTGIDQVTPASRQTSIQVNTAEHSCAEPVPAMPSARALSLKQVVHISKQIASGLAHLHSRELPAAKDEVSARVRSGVKGASIVHRDLKPANILINSEGIAKITDFGLARRHEQTTIATVHVGAGTLAYMAPELLVAAQMGTDHAVTNRVDIYSLGLMIWEMLAGEVPWRGLAATSILAAVINRRRPPLAGTDVDREHVTLYREGLTPQTSISVRHQEAGLSQLNNIIMSCWHHRELRRPAASAVLGMLSALEEQLQAQQQQQQQQEEQQQQE